jgi:hypothetical protein
MTWLKNLRVIFGVYAFLTVIFSLQKYSLGEIEENGRLVTRYNNYRIFKNSAAHLLQGKDLYAPYPDEQDDLYKYSPTFALFMLPFSFLPDAAGLVLWNLLNALTLFWAITRLPLNGAQQAAALWILFLELLISIQNCQSNALVAALMLWTFVAYEHQKYALAALCIAAGIYLKLYGVLAAALWLFYPEKSRVFSYAVVWSIALLIAPLAVTSSEKLMMQYAQWWNLLQNDYSAYQGMSVMGLLGAWFGLTIPKAIVIGLGALLMMSPMVQREKFNNNLHRLLFLSVLLIWSVIFNHKAESPTFVIALSGVAVWFVTSERSWVNTFLLATTLLLTSLSMTDLTPHTIRDTLVYRFELKVLPCILVWCKGLYDLFALNVLTLPHQQRGAVTL